MHRPPPRLNTAEAIASVQDYAEAGVQILGVDGFVVVPEGLRADLDLMLDVSEPQASAEVAAAQVEAFIRERARPDVVWEVWADVA
jgi:hypothetical protein